MKSRHYLSILTLTLVIAACSRADPEAAKRRHMQRGDEYAKQEKYAEAVIEYRGAVQADQRFGEARKKLADAYLKVNEGANALREYVRAADLLPQDAETQATAGKLLLGAGQFNEAKERAFAALRID